MVLTVNGKNYKIRFGYNCFCDSDIFDQVKAMLKLMQGEKIETDDDMANLGKVRDLFLVIRELVYLGLQKDNPVADLREAGDLLDDYRDEAPEGEKRSLMDLFIELTDELVNEGFLSDILGETEKPQKRTRTTKK
jgi:hypothetical protein